MKDIVKKSLMDANRKVTKKRDSINLPLNYSQALRMIFDLKIQIDALKKNNKAFIDINIDNIKLTGENTFIIDNFPQLYAIKNDKILISKPYSKSKYIAPELNNVDKLPIKINESASYFCISKLILDILNIDNNIKRIYPTKLFYLLERILVENPEKRTFLYI